MAGQIARALAAEYPEYLELKAILDLARVTWPRFGLSAAELSRMDGWQVEMIKATLEG